MNKRANAHMDWKCGDRTTTVDKLQQQIHVLLESLEKGNKVCRNVEKNITVGNKKNAFDVINVMFKKLNHSICC